MRKSLLAGAAIAITALLAGGCSKTEMTQPVGGATLGLKVVFSLATDDGSITNTNDITNHIQANSRPADLGVDSVTLTSGVAMVRSVRFVANPSAAPDTVITTADEARDLNDPTVPFSGPYVLLATGAEQALGITSVPAGFYPQVRFVLQEAQASDNLGNHPELAGSSLRISGKIWRNDLGIDFTYTTDYTSEIAVGGVFNVGSNVNGTLALTFNAGRWFRAGRLWLNPIDPANQLQITRNIRNNVSARIVAG